jgi:predicted nucleic acid-binding protein
MLIALDTGPLGDLINPNNTGDAVAIRTWMASHLAKGDKYLLPELADYEVRRNETLEVLICPIGPSQSAAAIYMLDQLKATITYLPLNTEAMLAAANLWAEHRKGTRKGDPARSHRLDGDVILTAQCMVRSAGIEQIVIATMNLRDFLHIPTPTVTAEEWHKI